MTKQPTTRMLYDALKQFLMYTPQEDDVFPHEDLSNAMQATSYIPLGADVTTIEVAIIKLEQAGLVIDCGRCYKLTTRFFGTLRCDVQLPPPAHTGRQRLGHELHQVEVRS